MLGAVKSTVSAAIHCHEKYGRRTDASDNEVKD